MDFFTSQDKARSKTNVLIFYFCLAIIGMILVIYVVCAALMNYVESSQATTIYTGDGYTEVESGISWLHLEILAIVAVSVIVVVGMSSLYKVMELRGGGERVAHMLGGRPISSSTTDPHERMVMNVVEEMALASGTPVPPVFVMDGEDSINAFAAGYSPNDAVIGVNRGTIETLNRAELQGVIAHEFSHILNGDMRLNIKLIGWLFGIQVLAIIGFYMFRFAGAMSHGNRDNKGNPAIVVFIIGIVVMIVGFLGQWCARMIQAAISRQREYLADASAVQFTRDPNTIGGALKVIGACEAGSHLEVPTASEASHMFFAEGVSNFGGASTHPPLIERIQRIDPSFKGDFNEYMRHRYKRPVKSKKSEKKTEQKDPMEMLRKLPVPGLGGEGLGPMGEMTQAMPGAAMAGAAMPMNPAAIIAGIGLLDEQHVEHSQTLIEQLPEAIRTAIHDTFSARCVVYSLLLDEDSSIRQKQLAAIQKAEGQPTVEETERLAPLVAKLPRAQRLPCLEIIQSTLSQLSLEQYKRFGFSVIEAVRADQKIDLFEFIMQHLLLTHLDRRFEIRPAAKTKYGNPYQIKSEVELILSILVHVGHKDEQESRKAFEQAAQTFEGNVDWQLVPKDKCNFQVLDRALERANESSPAAKKQILHAAATAIASDGKVTVDEAELFRAFAESMECPVPPILATEG